MSWDIYGNPLRKGHCEAHPHVHEPYPCSLCMSEQVERYPSEPRIPDPRTAPCPDCAALRQQLAAAQAQCSLTLVENPDGSKTLELHRLPRESAASWNERQRIFLKHTGGKGTRIYPNTEEPCQS